MSANPLATALPRPRVVTDSHGTLPRDRRSRLRPAGDAPGHRAPLAARDVAAVAGLVDAARRGAA